MSKCPDTPAECLIHFELSVNKYYKSNWARSPRITATASTRPASSPRVSYRVPTVSVTSRRRPHPRTLPNLRLPLT